MARGGKQSDELSLRLWRRRGPVRVSARGTWPFGIPIAGSTPLPVLWRDYGWACEMHSAGRKPRAAKAQITPLPKARGNKPSSFDCSALTAPLVPVCAFGLEMTKSVSLSWL